jgi:sulfate adenylyltransferase subunit 2
VAAECENPVMLYSIGKDSAVMLHLAAKAFYPSKPPFPLLHVDTTWKFRAMYELRDKVASELGFDLLVHKNPKPRREGINPFDHGSALHTDLWKTEGLKQALAKYGFDAAFGGARRDEEKSRAKERVFSFRTAEQRWDPKDQRPELWKLYNTRKHPGESLRVFPISNWTELDVWQYIHLENIPIVPLYFAAERPVVERDGSLIMVDDDRIPPAPRRGPADEERAVPHPGLLPADRRGREHRLHPARGHPGDAADHDVSERQGRVIDHDQSASMEKKKQEGYF